MSEKTLKLVDILQLDAELNGIPGQDGKIIFAGLLSNKLSLVAKYWINELAEIVVSEKKKIETLRTDLIKKFGTEDEKGNTIIEMWKDEEKTTLNENYEQFTKEYAELLDQPKEIKYKPIKLHLLENVETGENYPTFFKFVEP
jgi:hypothetical protein